MLELTRDHLPNHLTSLARRYGSIYRLNCGNTTIVVLSSAEVIREALVKKWSDFAGRPHSYTGDIVSGGGQSISLGDYSNAWRTHRRVAHSALQRCSAQSLHSVIQRQALSLRQYDKSSPELHRLHGCLNEIVSLWGSSWISALDSFPLLRVLCQDEGTGGTVAASLLENLDQPLGEKEKVALTETHVHMTTVDLLIGGTETTAAWLCWTVAFLLHRPEVQCRVYSELCTVLDTRYPQYSDRLKLPCLSALISEVLRLRPVAPLAVPHRATRDSSLKPIEGKRLEGKSDELGLKITSEESKNKKP
ncbi:hypothetical protein COCON_G00007050 [Conger conger]|uniref:Steroid 21-hydroxylase n=1 Tax=Conger conger TaxID=82655 RepID=A0A9Q1I8P4_CONCO|nr:hypothetical protein COCON_G00007050 [Conger conger]